MALENEERCKLQTDPVAGLQFANGGYEIKFITVSTLMNPLNLAVLGVSGGDFSGTLPANKNSW